MGYCGNSLLKSCDIFYDIISLPHYILHHLVMQYFLLLFLVLQTFCSVTRSVYPDFQPSSVMFLSSLFLLQVQCLASSYSQSFVLPYEQQRA